MAAVWEVIRSPESIPMWFLGIISCTVDGMTRVVTTATGFDTLGEIVVVDEHLHRFAYRITASNYRFHLGVIDVIEWA